MQSPWTYLGHERFSRWLGVPLNLQPKLFPVSADAAARLVIAVEQADGAAAALRLSGGVLAAVWKQERDIIASASTLAELLAECALPAQRLADATSVEEQAAYERCTLQAIAAGVFGLPSYVEQGEIFWGQDHLDFLERRLARP